MLSTCSGKVRSNPPSEITCKSLPFLPSPSLFQKWHPAGKPKLELGTPTTDASPASDNSLDPPEWGGTCRDRCLLQPPLTSAQSTPASSLRQWPRLRVSWECVPGLEQKEELPPTCLVSKHPDSKSTWLQDGAGNAKFPPNVVTSAVVWKRTDRKKNNQQY